MDQTLPLAAKGAAHETIPPPQVFVSKAFLSMKNSLNAHSWRDYKCRHNTLLEGVIYFGAHPVYLIF